jgi:hypothetical protein
MNNLPQVELMSQENLAKLHSMPPSQNALVLSYLDYRRGQWVPMPQLVEYGGGYAVHSRISDLRKDGHQIDNMVDRSARPYKSYYRLSA